VTVEYKGVSPPLDAGAAREMRQKAIVGDPGAPIGPDLELLKELREHWTAEDSEL